MEASACAYYCRIQSAQSPWQFQVYACSGDNCDLLRSRIFLHVATAARMHVSICFAAARMHVKTRNHNAVDCINDTRAIASMLLSQRAVKL